jgi:hypothetical protein
MEEQQAMIEIRILDNFPSLGGLTLHSVELQPGDRLVILEAPSRKSNGIPRMIDRSVGRQQFELWKGGWFASAQPYLILRRRWSARGDDD